MNEKKVVSINERIPSIKDQRKQRANRRLLFFLSFFFLLLLLMIYFQSPLSNIKQITLSGNQLVEDEEIIELSQLDERTSMWSIDKEEIRQRIMKHNEVKSAGIERKLPNTIHLTIEEYARIGYLYRNDHFYPILETGKYLAELPRGQLPTEAPVLINFEEGSALEELAAELAKVPSHVIERISEIFYEPTELDPLTIVLFMTDGIEVHTSIKDFSSRIEPYPSIAKELQNREGVLHLRMSPYFEEFDTEETEEEEDIEGEG